MGIIKQSKNMSVVVNKDYQISAGKISEVSNRVNIESKRENLQLFSNKKIDMQGKDGLNYKKYSPPELVVEKSEYKLESKYAHEQLCILADEIGEKTFMYWMLHIFGPDIEVEAFSKLYRALSDRSFEAPEITVTKNSIGGRKAAYSNKRRMIYVSQEFLDEAIKDDEAKGMLFTALVEEYGHHIDNLLRTDFSPTPTADEDIIDEGARFAYNFFTFDIFEETNLTFAKAETPEFNGELSLDFSELNAQLKDYVNDDQQFDGLPLSDVEYFGAGFIDKKEGYGHGTIEMEALAKSNLFTEDEVLQIYYGNWLRDFSQMIVEITISVSNGANKNVKKHSNNSVLKLSHQGWVDLLQILAAKEFVYNVAAEKGKKSGKPVTENYKVHLETFKKKFIPLTKDVLGVYRPEEHIDNPYKLKDESGATDLASGQPVAFLYESPSGKFKKHLFRGQPTSIGIDPARKMKKYIHGDGYASEKTNAINPSAVTYMKQQIILATRPGDKNKRFMHLGAALHVLEDYFSHSNFIEVGLIKNGASMVYPWVENKQGHKATDIPIVTGIFLTDDTVASVAPKMAEAMFPIHPSEYKTRKKGERTFAEGFMETMLQHLSKSQQHDKSQNNSNYKGVLVSSTLATLKKWFAFVDWKADFIEKNKDKPMGKYLIIIDKKMNSMGNTLSYLMNISFNIFLDVTDDGIKVIQSLSSGYGENPTHTQIAKDDAHHPLHRLAGEIAVLAVKDVGRKFKNGMDGAALGNYIAATYFIHPTVQNEWMNQVDEILKTFKRNNPKTIDKLKHPTIYHEHAPGVLRKIHQLEHDAVETMESMKRQFEEFKKNPGAYTQKRAVQMKKKIVETTDKMNDKIVEKINQYPTIKKGNDWLYEKRKKAEKRLEEIKHYILD